MARLSGLPKFNPSVIAIGVAPTHDTLRQASATAAAAPLYGSAITNLLLQSTDIASAFFVPLMRMTAASPPGPATVLFWTWWSYLRHIARLDAMFGDRSIHKAAISRETDTGGSAATSAPRIAAMYGGAGASNEYSGASVRMSTGVAQCTSSPQVTTTLESSVNSPMTLDDRSHLSNSSNSSSLSVGFTANSMRS